MKVYKTVNIVLLSLTVYMLLLPLISPFLAYLLPDIWTCQYLRITGKPCPFCHITRDVLIIIQGYGKIQNPLSIPFIVAGFFELSLRILLIAIINKIKNLKPIILSDIIYHGVMTFSLAVYTINFFINQR